MRIKAWIIPLAIYIVGLAIVLHYAFTTDYINHADSPQEYALYLNYARTLNWQDYSITHSVYDLQKSCLVTTLFPAIIQKITHLPALGFYHVYLSVLIAFIPVAVYFISRRFVGDYYAVFASIFIMGWVCFYQGASMARSNVAVLAFALIVLTLLTDKLRLWQKMGILVALGGWSVVSHYTTTYITFMAMGAYVLVTLYRRYVSRVGEGNIIPVLAMLFVMLVGIVTWYGMVNVHVMDNTKTAIAESVETVRKTFIERKPIEVDYQEADSGDPLIAEYDALDIRSRSKVTQAIFGDKNPDGDKVYQFHPMLLVMGWLTIMLTAWGLWRAFRRRILPHGYKAWLCVLLVLAVASIVDPMLSRGYGVERVYFQALMLTAPIYVIGGQELSRLMRIPAWILLLCITCAYGYFMYNYGIIHSIAGY